MKVTKKVIAANKKLPKNRVVAADEDFDDFGDYDDETDGIMDAIDDVADNLEDLQDNLDDVDSDDIDISLNNNVSNHYIAECDKCQGIFISAVIESDADIDHVSGVCPLCNNETDQYLKWVIKAVNDTKGDVK